jgi:hypothetical protein
MKEERKVCMKEGRAAQRKEGLCKRGRRTMLRKDGLHERRREGRLAPKDAAARLLLLGMASVALLSGPKGQAWSSAFSTETLSTLP